MIGTILGVLFFVVLALVGITSWWWLILGGFAGGFIELSFRFGNGEDVAMLLSEIVEAFLSLLLSIVDVFSAFSSKSND